jgi:addiction module RelB/DinJ family antitoxin
MMAKDTSISIRLDSQLKESTESVLAQFGLNMTVVVNMLFHQIVREQAIPLSLTLQPHMSVVEELRVAEYNRSVGYIGRNANVIADDMEQLIAEAVNDERKV